MDVLLDVVTATVDKSDGRAKSDAVARLAPTLRALPDRVVQSHYIGLLSVRLGVDERVIQSEINRRNLVRPAPTIAGNAPFPSDGTAGRSAVNTTNTASTENHLVAILLAHRSLCRDIIDQVNADDIHDVRNRLILQVLQDPLLPNLDGDSIVIGLDESIAEYGEQLLVAFGARPGRTAGNVRQEATQALRSLQREHYTRLLRQLDQGLRAAQQSGDSESVAEITAQMSLLLARHQTANPPPSPYFRDSRNGRQAR